VLTGDYLVFSLRGVERRVNAARPGKGPGCAAMVNMTIGDERFASRGGGIAALDLTQGYLPQKIRVRL
jgi:hypothetical protein